MKVLPLLDAIATAALDGAQWLPTLGAIADATGSARAQLIGIGGPRSIPFNIVNATDPRDLARFVAIGGGDPAINFRVAAALRVPAMTVVAEREYEAEIPHLVTDVYVDFCRDTDMMFGCQTVLFNDHDGMVGFALARGDRDGRVTDDQRALFTAIAARMRSAVHIQRTIEQDGENLLLGAYDAMAVAAFACDDRRRLRGHSAAAARLLQQGRLIVHDGRLASPSPRETEAFDRALAGFAADPLADPVRTLVLRDGHADDPLILDLIRPPRRAWSLGLAPRLLVVARGRGIDPVRTAGLLRRTYGLSEAEAHVAIGYAQGHSRDHIARIRGVSVHTVRVQTKALFTKLEVRREVELATLVARFL